MLEILFNTLNSCLKKLFLLILAVVLLLQAPTIFAISRSALESVVNGRAWYDPTADCSVATPPSGSSTSTASGPGAVFVLGDSIGVGLTPKLQTALPASDSWSVSGDSASGRKLSEGITKAESSPAGLSNAKYILVVLGTNPDTKNNAAGITEMVNKLKEKNANAKIYWLKVNVTRSDLTAGATTFNTALGANSNITVLENTATLSSDQVHPSDYTPLATQVASNITSTQSAPSGSTSPTAQTTGTPTENRDKVAMLVMARAYSRADITSLASGKAGGIFLGPNDKNDRTFFDGVKSALNGYTGLVSVDFEGGTVQRPGDQIVGAVPSAQEMGSMSDEDIKALAKEKGQQLAAFGINMDFAPVVDIGGTNQAVINTRAFSNNADTVRDKARAFSEGLAEAGIISTLKHFPGHGSKDGDSHRAPVATESLATLEDRDLKPYRALSSNARTAIMMGHLLVPEWGGTATSLNPQAYEYIRQVLNFNKVVITDALDMQGITGPADEPSRALIAIKAGADMALLNSPQDFTPTVAKLEAALASGELTQARVDEAVSRVVELRSQASASSTTEAPGCAPCPTGTGTGVPIDGDHPQRLFAFLVGNGLSKEQAAGVTGAIMVESGPNIDPTIVGGAGNNYKGIAQWDLNRGGRWENLVNWVTQQGKDPLSFEAQVEYMWKEANERMNSPAGYSAGPSNIEGIKQQPTIELTAWYWTRFFEIATTGGSSVEPMQNAQALPERIAYGYDVLQQFGDTVAGTSSIGGSGGGSCSGAGASDGATIVGEFAWPVPASFWESNQQWFTKTHHDYAASDIPVPRGTAVYSMTSGTATFSGGDCGEGVTVTTGSAVFTYCHGITGSRKITDGQTVTAGQHLFDVNDTGHSFGDHLHVQIKINGVKHCPQQLFIKMGNGETNIDLASLPTSGCSH